MRDFYRGSDGSASLARPFTWIELIPRACTSFVFLHLSNDARIHRLKT
jgi:hypothetical protein